MLSEDSSQHRRKTTSNAFFPLVIIVQYLIQSLCLWNLHWNIRTFSITRIVFLTKPVSFINIMPVQFNIESARCWIYITGYFQNAIIIMWQFKHVRDMKWNISWIISWRVNAFYLAETTDQIMSRLAFISATATSLILLHTHTHTVYLFCQQDFSELDFWTTIRFCFSFHEDYCFYRHVPETCMVTLKDRLDAHT